MNYDYRATARHENISIDIVQGDDMTTFPIEKARFRSIWYSIGAAGFCTIGYGWALQFRVVSSQKRTLRDKGTTDNALGNK